MARVNFLDFIKSQVVLGDGGLGSYFFDQGVERGRNLDLLNLQAEEIVANIHEEYIRAGSLLIETNTFGANRFKLREAGAEAMVRQVNLAGASLARKAAGRQIFVAGSVGPSGEKLNLDEDSVSEIELSNSFKEQIAALLEGEVDLLILETFNSLAEITIAIKAARELSASIPIVAQMVFPLKGTSVNGRSSHFCGQQMVAAGADIVGSNCGRGVDSMVAAIEQMAPLASEEQYLSAFPNAGLPETVAGRTVYPAQPSYMARRMKKMINLGARLIGGCCGTTPAHIHEFRSFLKIKPARVRVETAPATDKPGADRLVGEHKKGRFLAELSPDRLSVIVELDPPTNLNIESIITGAKKLAEAGVDAISLGDNPLAILRAGNLAMASLIKKEVGIKTIIHQTGRDLNGLALQSRMMEAHLLGIEGVLAVSGDSAAGSDQPGVSGVFDLRSNSIIKMIAGFNQGVNMAGRSLSAETDFSIGAAFSFRPENPRMQISRLERKVDLGARFALTQPLFSAQAVESMLEEIKHVDIMIFPGIFPLISLRNAEFLHNEVPGIYVPKELRKKLSAYDDVRDQRKAALDYTREMVEDIKGIVKGLYLISPLNKWNIVLDIVRRLS